MRIEPIALHAQLRIPSLTGLFSDAMNVTSIDVVSGGLTTLNFGSAHGLALASEIAISITDAETPNPITAAEVIANEFTDVKLTTQYEHDLTTTPDLKRAQPWRTVAKLDGFGDAKIDGVKSLVSVPDRNSIVVRPTGEVGSVTIDGGETLFERLEREIVGYHAATVASTTTLTFTTPAAITRDFTIQTPTVVTNMRCFAVASLEAAIAKYVSNTDQSGIPATAAHLFVAPVDVTTSRSVRAQLDGLAEIHEGADYRVNLIDGFEVLVVIPAQRDPGGVKASDQAHGSIFNAVMKTFFGLKMARPEIAGATPYVAFPSGHQMVRYDNANYWHKYSFQAMVELANEDAIAPYDWPDIDPDNLQSTFYPVDAPVLRDVVLTGIKHDGEPGELSGDYELDDNP